MRTPGARRSTLSEPPTFHSPVDWWLAAALCIGLLALSLYTTRHFLPGTPDTEHFLVAARSLVEGDGYRIDYVTSHFGMLETPLFDGARPDADGRLPVPKDLAHVPEWHGVAPAFVYAGLFRVLGVDPHVARIPGLVYTALGGLAVFALTRRLFGSLAGLIACLLSVTSVNLLALSIMGVDDLGFCCFFLHFVNFLHLGLTSEKTRYFLLAGTCAGIALAAKPIGVFVPGFGVALLLRWRRVPLTTLALWGICLALPFLAFFGTYMARNHAAYGGLGFRVGALNWMFKTEGYDGFFGLYDQIPTVSESLALLGWERVVEIGLTQLSHFAEGMIRVHPLLWGSATQPGFLPVPPYLLVAALLLLPLFLRRHLEFVVLFLLSLVGSVLFVCSMYHYEFRYFVMLLQLSTIPIAGLTTLPRPGTGGTWEPVLRWTARAFLALVVCVSVGEFARAQILASQARPGPAPCDDAIAWLASETPRKERILSFEPWHVTWASRRESVVIPGGGVEAIATVARRYDTRWLIFRDQPSRPETNRAVRALLRGEGPLTLESAFRGTHCDVHRIGWREVGG